MKEKKRLYEIFSKVNELSLNEDAFDQFDSQEMYDLRDDILYDIEMHFQGESDDRIFQYGIPEEIRVRIRGEDVEFKMFEENGLKLTDASPNKINYTATYSSDLSEINERLASVNAILTIPVILKIEEKRTGNKIDFNLNIDINSDNIKTSFEEIQ